MASGTVRDSPVIDLALQLRGLATRRHLHPLAAQPTDADIDLDVARYEGFRPKHLARALSRDAGGRRKIDVQTARIAQAEACDAAAARLGLTAKWPPRRRIPRDGRGSREIAAAHWRRCHVASGQRARASSIAGVQCARPDRAGSWESRARTRRRRRLPPAPPCSGRRPNSRAARRSRCHCALTTGSLSRAVQDRRDRAAVLAASRCPTAYGLRIGASPAGSDAGGRNRAPPNPGRSARCRGGSRACG